MSFDAVIIGAGVIGAALALELSKAGFKTLNVDKNHDAGWGQHRVHVLLFGCIIQH